MKYCFTLFMLLFLTTFAHSQAYESIFGQDSTQWNIANMYPDALFTETFIPQGDTIINGEMYKVIQNTHYTNPPLYIGFLREDTIQGKVWFRSWLDTTERLVMDLSLTVGDSVVLGENPITGHHVVVDSVFYLNNRKHIRLNHQHYTHLSDQPFMFIEGEVSTMGFYFYDGHLGSESSYLLCTHKDGLQTYNFADTCFVMSTATKEIVAQLDFTVFPNPAEDFFNVEIKEEFTQNYTGQLINITGKILQTTRLQSNSENRVYLENAPSGISFLLIYNENNQIVGKRKIVIF